MVTIQIRHKLFTSTAEQLSSWKMIFGVKVLVVAVSWTCMMASVQGGGGGGHHKVVIKAEYPHHTHHKHHTEKVPEVKIIEVPVIKEVKVLQPYKVPYKVKVPYIIHQEIHKVPVYKKEVHTSEHVHHHHTKHSHDEEDAHFSPSASDPMPIYASHSPVGEGSHDSSVTVQHSESNQRAYNPEIWSLNTKIDAASMGFGSQEGQMTDKDNGWPGLEMPKRKQQASAIPYPFSEEQVNKLSGKHRIPFDYTFHPNSFDFVSFH